MRRYGGCPNDEDYKIVRSYYYWEWQGDEDWKPINCSKEDYDKYKDSEEEDYRTELNYKDFENKFWFNKFSDFLMGTIEPNEQLDFINCLKETFYNLNFEGQVKLFLKDVITQLIDLSDSLKLVIKHQEKDYRQNINKIQKYIINQYSGSYLNAKQIIIRQYKFIYPEIEKVFVLDDNLENLNLTRDEILKKLTGDNKNIPLFNKYEKKLLSHKYLSKDNEWIKKSANLIKVLNHCERKKIFQSHFNDGTRGTDLLRKLYNFHNNKTIDTPKKRIKQDTQLTKTEFYFLDID